MAETENHQEDDASKTNTTKCNKVKFCRAFIIDEASSSKAPNCVCEICCTERKKKIEKSRKRVTNKLLRDAPKRQLSEQLGNRFKLKMCGVSLTRLESMPIQPPITDNGVFKTPYIPALRDALIRAKVLSRRPNVEISLVRSDEKVGQATLVNSCSYCIQDYSTKNELYKHFKKAHGLNVFYQCPVCTVTFLTDAATVRHLFVEHSMTKDSIKNFKSTVGPFSIDKLKKKATPTMSIQNCNVNVDRQWMIEWETNNVSPKCGGCGADFERPSDARSHIRQCEMRKKVMLKLRAKKLEQKKSSK